MVKITQNAVTEPLYSLEGMFILSQKVYNNKMKFPRLSVW